MTTPSHWRRRIASVALALGLLIGSVSPTAAGACDPGRGASHIAIDNWAQFWAQSGVVLSNLHADAFVMTSVDIDADYLIAWVEMRDQYSSGRARVGWRINANNTAQAYFQVTRRDGSALTNYVDSTVYSLASASSLPLNIWRLNGSPKGWKLTVGYGPPYNEESNTLFMIAGEDWTGTGGAYYTRSWNTANQFFGESFAQPMKFDDVRYTSQYGTGTPSMSIIKNHFFSWADSTYSSGDFASADEARNCA